MIPVPTVVNSPVLYSKLIHNLKNFIILRLFKTSSFKNTKPFLSRNITRSFVTLVLSLGKLIETLLHGKQTWKFSPRPKVRPPCHACSSYNSSGTFWSFSLPSPQTLEIAWYNCRWSPVSSPSVASRWARYGPSSRRRTAWRTSVKMGRVYTDRGAERIETREPLHQVGWTQELRISRRGGGVPSSIKLIVIN